MQKSLGWALALAIVAGVALILLLNLDLAGTRRSPNASPDRTGSTQSQSGPAATAPDAAAAGTSGMFREYFIGDEVECAEQFLAIAPVFFPAVPMDGMSLPSGDNVIHLEADVRGIANNPNGFALGQFIPYLKVTYEIVPTSSGEPLKGDLVPMVARDGLHYGATVVMPGNGKYRLTYHLEPPTSGALGRHNDFETGVAPWWSPFDVSWDWDYTTIDPTQPADSAGAR
jgi:uncharacterized protein involved in high-affinity Fe2+ transport